MLTDTHCHLASRQFHADLPEVIQRARDAGVTRMVTLATDLDDAPTCLRIAERFDEVRAAVGVHPTSVCEIEAEDWLERVEAMAAHPRVAAIGEIGLDYYHAPPKGVSLASYRERQKEFLRRQLELAARLGKNVVLHNRESWDDLVTEVAPFRGRLRAVFHCFTGTWKEAAKVVADGHLVSFTGIATYAKPGAVLATATRAPLDAFMLETDAPYLSPTPHRGKRCEPAFVRHTAEVIAANRGMDWRELARATTKVAEGFFAFAPARGV